MQTVKTISALSCLRRGTDFYPQEEVLAQPSSAAREGERNNSEEDDPNGPSTSDERVRQRYLEIFYRIFAQPNKLTLSQVAIVGTTLSPTGAGEGGASSEASEAVVPLKRKLKSLDHFQVDLGRLTGKENNGRALALLRPKLESMFDFVLAKSNGAAA